MDKRRVVCHKNNAVVLKSYTNSNIDQLGVCTVKLRYRDNIVKCRFFVVPGNAPALLRMMDIEVLGILRIVCEVIDGQQAGRNFDCQMI